MADEKYDFQLAVTHTSGSQEIFYSTVQELCRALHSQVSLARHSFWLQGLPPKIHDAVGQALKDFDECIDSANSELCACMLQSETQITPELNRQSSSITRQGSTDNDDLSVTKKLTHRAAMDATLTATAEPGELSNRSSVVHQYLRRNSIPRISVPNRMTMSTLDDPDLHNAGEEQLGIFVDGVFNPNWPGRLAWDMSVILLVVVDAMVLPFQLAYKDDEPPDTFDTFWQWATTGFFALDIVLSFLTAYQAGDKDPEPGALVKSKGSIARNYIKTWFIIDIASTIPWGLLASLLASGDKGGGEASAGQMAKLTKIVKFVRFLRLMRMLRLAKLAQIWERVEANLGSVILRQSVALLRVMCALVVICHWNACIWWMIGNPESMLTEVLSKENKKHFQTLDHWTTVERSDGGDPYRWSDRTRTEQYIFCFYWTLGVMRTMPSEVTPVNLVERVYVMIFMFFAFSAFAICVALITQTFFKFADRKRAFDDTMACVRMHMRDRKISKNLQTVVKTYLRFLYDKRYVEAKELSMIDKLPNAVQKRLKYERLQKHMEKLQVWSRLSDVEKVCLTQVSEEEKLYQGGRLTTQGRTADAVYILVSGRLRATPYGGALNLKEHPTVVDEETLDRDWQCKQSIHAMVCCELIRINKLDFRTKISELKEAAGKHGSESEPLDTQAADKIMITKRSDQHIEAAVAAVAT